MATTKVSKGLIQDGAITIDKLNNALVVTEAEGIVNNDNDITIPTSAAVKQYVDSNIVGGLVYQGAYDAATNSPSLDNRGSQIAVTKGWTYTVTVEGTFYGESVRVGDVLIAEVDLPAGTGALTDWTTVQSNIDLATAGTESTAIRGLSGFDDNNFIVSNGFVNLKTGDIIPSSIVESIVAGTGIAIDVTDAANPIVSNTAPDQVVGLTAGSNVTITGTYPNFTIAASDSTGLASVVAGTAISVDNTDPANPIINNTAPDQTVILTGSGSAVVTGTYPSFNVAATDTTYTAGTGIAIDGSNVISNTAPDQTVVLTGAGGTTITGTYPSFTITSTDNQGVTSIVAGAGIIVDSIDPYAPIVTNSAPDQVVSLTGSGGTTVTGTYPSFTIASDPSPTVLPSDFVYISVKNETGSTIAKGTGVMAVGTDGNSGHVLIAPMVADGSVEPKYFVGILDEDILNGGIGVAVTQGEIDQLNTNAFLDGDILWCSPSTPGTFVVTEPSAPNLKIAAAIVLNSATNGKILVRVQGNEGLHELHDVGINTATLADGQLLTYDSIAGYWKNSNTIPTLNVTNTFNLPVGDEAERPAAPEIGSIRFNTDLNKFEGYDGENWVQFVTVLPGLTGIEWSYYLSNGTTNSYILLSAPINTTSLFVYTNGVYQSSSAYSISNNVISFNTILPADVKIDFIYLVSTQEIVESVNYIGNGTINTFSVTKPIVSTNAIQLFVDGVYQNKGSYTISGLDIILDTAPSVGAIINIMNIYDAKKAIELNLFNGNGITTDFNITTAPSLTNAQLQVYINGVYQMKNSYTVNGATVSFSEAPNTESVIEIINFVI